MNCRKKCRPPKSKTVILLKPSEEMDDETGEPKLTFNNTGVVKAYIKPLRGRELVYANQTVMIVTHMFEMLYTGLTSNITPKWKLQYDGREFGITSVINIEENNRDLEIMAVEEIA